MGFLNVLSPVDMAMLLEGGRECIHIRNTKNQNSDTLPKNGLIDFILYTDGY